MSMSYDSRMGLGRRLQQNPMGQWTQLRDWDVWLLPAEVCVSKADLHAHSHDCLVDMLNVVIWQLRRGSC